MANQGGGGGNGQSGGDLIVTMQSAVKRLQDTLGRHQGETKGGFKQVRETKARLDEGDSRLDETVSRDHRETMEDIGQIAEILAAVGSKLKDHERRLGVVEAKIL